MNVFDQFTTNRFSAYNVDTVEFTANMPDNSVHFSIFSPPFSSLFIYSESERDMGNVANHDEFAIQHEPLVHQLFRILKPGRVAFVHCSDIPTTASRDGVIGLYDFPALLMKIYQKAGFTYHSKVTIWKDPVVEMTRTKAHGLLYKTFRLDATRCRVGMPDYCLVFRKPTGGENEKTPDPVVHDSNAYPVQIWQELASPVWMTINQTNTLNEKMARDAGDERHVCPLQLDVIERALTLYTNPGDVVYSPFMGIGSEGYASLKMERKFIGTELKGSYYKQAVKYLQEAERLGGDLLKGAA